MRSVPLLIFFAVALAAETTFLFPHRWQDARYRLVRLISEGAKELLVVNDGLDDPSLRRAIRKALAGGRRVRLFTTEMENAAAWSVYRNMDACLLPNADRAPLGFSLVAAADGEACFLSVPLRTEQLRNRTGVMHCSKSTDYRQLIETLRSECVPYFK